MYVCVSVVSVSVCVRLTEMMTAASFTNKEGEELSKREKTTLSTSDLFLTPATPPERP